MFCSTLEIYSLKSIRIIPIVFVVVAPYWRYTIAIIGAHYAYMNIKTLLYNVLQQFEIEPLVPLKEILPKDQVFGVFRPTKTCLVKLRRNPNAKPAWITDETTFARKETVSTG